MLKGLWFDVTCEAVIHCCDVELQAKDWRESAWILGCQKNSLVVGFYNINKCNIFLE